MSDVFTLPRLGGGHVSKHFGIGGITHNATDVTDFVGRNQFLKKEIDGLMKFRITRILNFRLLRGKSLL